MFCQSSINIFLIEIEQESCAVVVRDDTVTDYD